MLKPHYTQKQLDELTRANMTPRDFVYWLQGYFELGGESLSKEQIDVIKEHIALVLKKETISYINHVNKPNKNDDILCYYQDGPPASC